MNSITIGTYNVKNLFDASDVRPGTRTPVKSDRSKDALAENITRTDADVVTLQECSSKETLTKFMQTRGLDKIYPHVIERLEKDKAQAAERRTQEAGALTDSLKRIAPIQIRQR